jgi:hypothetical protein
MDTPRARPKPDRRNNQTRGLLLERVTAEFREMPRLQQTQAQATRLFGLESGVCERVLGKLVSEHVLSRDARGRYALREEG